MRLSFVQRCHDYAFQLHHGQLRCQARSSMLPSGLCHGRTHASSSNATTWTPHKDSDLAFSRYCDWPNIRNRNHNRSGHEWDLPEADRLIVLMGLAGATLIPAAGNEFSDWACRTANHSVAGEQGPAVCQRSRSGEARTSGQGCYSEFPFQARPLAGTPDISAARWP